MIAVVAFQDLVMHRKRAVDAVLDGVLRGGSPLASQEKKNEERRTNVIHVSSFRTTNSRELRTIPSLLYKVTRREERGE